MSLHKPLDPMELAGRRQRAEELRCERIRQGLTAAAVAEQVEVGATTLLTWERGAAWPKDPSHPRKWARALGL